MATKKTPVTPAVTRTAVMPDGFVWTQELEEFDELLLATCRQESKATSFAELLAFQTAWRQCQEMSKKSDSHRAIFEWHERCGKKFP